MMTMTTRVKVTAKWMATLTAMTPLTWLPWMAVTEPPAVVVPALPRKPGHRDFTATSMTSQVTTFYSSGL
jgi:hypothetical protein